MTIRCHNGLRELHDLCSSAKSFLGPQKSYKFIYDQDTQESTLTCSSFRLLENLDLTSSVGQLLFETIQGHHRTYRTGTTTLFFLVGAWSKGILECLNQGVPVSLIVSIMLEGLDSCIDIVDSLCIKLDHVHIADQNVMSLKVESLASLPTHPDASGSHPSNHLHRNLGYTGRQTQMARLNHSRHFSNRSFSHNSGTTFSSNNPNLRSLTKSLSHGNSEVMRLLEKAVSHICESFEASFVTKETFQPSNLELCTLGGSSDAFSDAFLGYTTLVSAETCEVVKNIQSTPLKVLLLDGELTEKYRHLGFNKATNVRSQYEYQSSQKSEDEDSWINNTCRKLIHANINVILLRGDVCPQVLMQCRLLNILIIPQVPLNVLQAFSECTGAELVTYLTQINGHSVGRDVYVTVCTRGSSVIQCGHRIAVNIRAERFNLATVVLSCMHAKAQMLEDQFWTAAYRLHHALGDQKVFPGGGSVEVLCLSHLRRLEEISSSDSLSLHPSSWLSANAMHYKGYVYRCLADGFSKYLSILLCNIGEYSSELQANTVIEKELRNIHDSPSSYILNEYFKQVSIVGDQRLSSSHGTVKVYDNVLPKLQAWRSALHLVLIVLQSDAEIITGSSTHTQMVKGDLVNEGNLFL